MSINQQFGQKLVNWENYQTTLIWLQCTEHKCNSQIKNSLLWVSQFFATLHIFLYLSGNPEFWVKLKLSNYSFWKIGLKQLHITQGSWPWSNMAQMYEKSKL